MESIQPTINMVSFPLGIAKGRYFCNRKEETQKLIKNIKNSTHTVLISPRRYGKTSLAYKALTESKLPNARVDLYMTTSAIEIERAIIAGVDRLLSQIHGSAENLLAMIKGYLKYLRPTFEAGTTGLNIKLVSHDKASQSANICEALQILDGVLHKKSLHAVLLIDEFQEIECVAANHGIEGAIRHVAQETKNFTIIFSGSHRNLLRSMFNTRNKPLYRLCDEIHLTKIHPAAYEKFLMPFAVEKWGKPLRKNVFDHLMFCTEAHPYYVNALCEKLFSQDHFPSEKHVKKLWDLFTLSKKPDILNETKNLNIAQKKLLVSIAHGINKELTGQKFLSQSELPGSTIIRSLEYLEENDFIEKDNDHYILIDPLLKNSLQQLNYI